MSDVCSHADIELAWSNAADAREAEALPYGHPVLQLGLCIACGSRLVRRLRVDGWSMWRPGDEAERP